MHGILTQVPPIIKQEDFSEGEGGRKETLLEYQKRKSKEAARERRKAAGQKEKCREDQIQKIMERTLTRPQFMIEATNLNEWAPLAIQFLATTSG